MSDDKHLGDREMKVLKARTRRNGFHWNKEEYEIRKNNVLKGYSNIIKGKISEIIAYLFLEEKGYIVGEYDVTIDLLRNKEQFERKIKSIKKYFSDVKVGKADITHWDRFLYRKKYFNGLDKKLNQIYDKWGDEILNNLLNLSNKYGELAGNNNVPTYYPDLFAKKDEKWYIIEVKSESSKLRAHQRTGLKESRKLGFTSILIHVPIECHYEFARARLSVSARNL